MIESVGTAKVIYTVEPHPENEGMAVVTYWLENGVRIGQMDVRREEGGGKATERSDSHVSEDRQRAH